MAVILTLPDPANPMLRTRCSLTVTTLPFRAFTAELPATTTEVGPVIQQLAGVISALLTGRS
jgi:hypothetical protein